MSLWKWPLPVRFRFRFRSPPPNAPCTPPSVGPSREMVCALRLETIVEKLCPFSPAKQLTQSSSTAEIQKEYVPCASSPQTGRSLCPRSCAPPRAPDIRHRLCLTLAASAPASSWRRQTESARRTRWRPSRIGESSSSPRDRWTHASCSMVLVAFIFRRGSSCFVELYQRDVVSFSLLFPTVGRVPAPRFAVACSCVSVHSFALVLW